MSTLLSTSLASIAAEREDEALSFAIRQCIQLPKDELNFKESLASHGWIESSDEAGLVLLMGSYLFSSSHALESKEQLEKSIHRALFLAPQIVFETSSRENTVLFHSGDHTLGVVGLFMNDSELPFCILGGPETAGETISEIVSLAPAPTDETGTWHSTSLSALEGNIGTAKVTLMKTDVQKVHAAIASFDIPELPIKTLNLNDVLAAYRPVNISIVRNSSIQEE